MRLPGGEQLRKNNQSFAGSHDTYYAEGDDSDDSDSAIIMKN